MSEPLDHHGALIYAMVTMSAVDRTMTDAELARIREVMRAWIEEQDAFDRERNHFLKAFRKENGFDRAGYALEVRERFERGLEEIGRGEDWARRRKAEVLASIGSAGGG